MKRTIIVSALLLASAAAFATPAIQTDARKKDAKANYTCMTCHAKMPGTKANLTAEGLKWVPVKK